MGSRLIPRLAASGHDVLALVREQSRHKLPDRCTPILGDVLHPDLYRDALSGCDTFIHLAGVSHPSPAKAREFREVDRPGALGAIGVARDAGIRHFVYLSVAHPAPVMRDYIEVRTRCEAAIAQAGLNATILRPWYVLGPGHWWPYALLPFYKIAELVPATREGALRLGLVTIEEMLAALAHAVENPPRGIRVLEPKDIRGVTRSASVREPAAV